MAGKRSRKPWWAARPRGSTPPPFAEKELMCNCGECVPCRRRAYDRRRWLESPARRSQTAARLARWREHKRFFVEMYLCNHPCVDCGESDPVVLEFDHVRGVKLNNVSNLISGMGKFHQLMDEISKCDVRCANCHRKKTHRLKEWRNQITGFLEHE